tara:strand:- start:190 stop:396 length:207 start_codon:yes stop_codon:yes gene_type:complete
LHISGDITKKGDRITFGQFVIEKCHDFSYRDNEAFLGKDFLTEQHLTTRQGTLFIDFHNRMNKKPSHN